MIKKRDGENYLNLIMKLLKAFLKKIK